MKNKVEYLEFLDIEYDKKWTTLDLFKEIKRLYSIENNGEFIGDKDKKYYYMKIEGYYPESLVKLFNRCDYCPYKNIGMNSHFLLDDYIPNSEENKNNNNRYSTLILKSSHWDFKEYDIDDCYINFDKIYDDKPSKIITKITFYAEDHNILYKAQRGVYRLICTF